MEFSDILTIAEIFISVVVSFYLVHWYNVRDTQHRAVKDYYIQLLSEYQKTTEDIFQSVLDSQISASQVVSKVEDLDIALEGFDKDIRRALPIKLQEIQLQIGDLTDALTNLDDINEQFDYGFLFLGTSDRIAVRELRKKAHECFGIYINQINTSEGHHAWHDLKCSFKNSVDYFNYKGKTFPYPHALWDLIRANLLRIIALVLGLIISFLIYKSYQSYQKEKEVEEENQTRWRDGIIKEMKTHNEILEDIKNTSRDIHSDTKNYYNCVFHRYDTCDSTIYFKEFKADSANSHKSKK